MKGTLVVMVLCGLAGAALVAAQSHDPKQIERKVLAQETLVQGYMCEKGYAFFYSDGHLQQCAVPREAQFGVAHVPAGSWINLRNDGKPDFVFLEHDTEIAGYTCRGGNRLLGPREGAMTGLYPSGKLKYCWLTADREVQGVPCARSGMFSGSSSVEFFEDGKLKACKLTKDYGKQKRGERFTQPQ